MSAAISSCPLGDVVAIESVSDGDVRQVRLTIRDGREFMYWTRDSDEAIRAPGYLDGLLPGVQWPK